MNTKLLWFVTICSIWLTSAGCSWTRDTVIDNVANFPASSVINDVKKTSSEYGEEQHQERVDELSEEYEEFLKSRDGELDQGDAEQSVIMRPDSTQN